MTSTPPGLYPRQLTVREQSWLDWVLPADRRGYAIYHSLIHTLEVIGEGRRGEGEIILGDRDRQPDVDAPLPPVFAYGMIETNFGSISITVREEILRQVSVEIVNHRSDRVPDDFEESRRWTYSTWDPDLPCPQCHSVVREVSMETNAGEELVLTLCSRDKRLWVFEASTRVNHLIPITNYYNELMLHKNIRDPKIALDNTYFFNHTEKFSNQDLIDALVTYNRLRTKINLEGQLIMDRSQKDSIAKRFRLLLGGSHR